MRAAALLALALAGCAARAAAPTLAVPNPTPGHVEIVATALDGLGDVQPIAVGLTSARPEALHVDPRQVFAHAATVTDPRIAPLPPAEAARRAGGRRLPGAVRAGAAGAATGGFLGALGGLVSGAIQGGIGGAVAVGSAVGATVGAVGGAIGGGRTPPAEVAAFSDRALPETTLRAGFSATGYLYFPAGSYRVLEVLLTDERNAVVESRVVPVRAPDR